MPTGTRQVRVMPKSEKIKSITLAVVELCLSEGISRLLSSQPVSYSVIKNFQNSNLMKVF